MDCDFLNDKNQMFSFAINKYTKRLQTVMKGVDVQVPHCTQMFIRLCYYSITL